MINNTITFQTASLPNYIKPYKAACDSTRDYIHKLRRGEIRSLKTSKKKLNEVLMNGIDWWRIMAVAGLPGGGKSTFISELKRDFINLNKDQSFEVLSFEFEMRMEDQIARDLSSKVGKTVKELYSYIEPLDDRSLQNVEDTLEEMEKFPVFYVEKTQTATEVCETIRNFAAIRDLGPQKGLVVTIDHILLTKGKSGESEKAKIDELCHALVEVKKYFSAVGVPIIIVMLSQLNRDIQSVERTSNPKLHYPNMNDLFAASSVYQCCDYVIIIHRPSTIVGMGEYYGPAWKSHPQGLPVMCPTMPARSMIYLHVIKERFGTTKIISCIEDFASAKITEYNFN